MVVRENYENKLQELKDKIIEMNRLTVSSFEKAFTAFKTQDIELALKVIEEDTAIDNLEAEINQFVVWLMVKEQPVVTNSW